MLVNFDESLECLILPGIYSEESTTKPSKRIKYCLNTKIQKKNKEMKQHHQFTSDQDKRILIGVLKNGPKFDKIARNFPCSINVVKNRYYKYLRYRWDIVLGRSEYAGLNYPHPTQVYEQILEIERLEHQIGLDDQMQSILKPFLYKLATFYQRSEMQ